ncbi:MAG: DUF998 domain-containing protein [Acidimicrobiales bacterium]
MAAVAVLWATVGTGMARTGLGLIDDRPVSFLGTEARTAGLFRAGLLLASALLAGFAWIVARLLRRRTGFLTVFLVGMAGQAIVAVVPLDSAGAGHAVHTTSGIVLGLSLPPLMWRFAAGLPPGPDRRLAFGLMAAEATGCVVGIVLSSAGVAALAEVVPAVLFHLWIVVVTVRWRAWRPAPVPAAGPPVSS